MVEEMLEKLSSAVIGGDEEAAKKAAKDAIDAGLSPVKAIEEGLAKGMKEVGRKFGDGEIFLTGMMLAADAMKAALSLLEPLIAPEELGKAKLGKIVIGTMYGDIHDLGKDIVSTLLTASGFEVHDIGIDANPRDFVEKASEIEADIIGMSCLLSPSLPYQRDVVKELEDSGARSKYYVVIGGGATHPEWAREIGADGWGLHAQDGVEVCKQLMKKRPTPPLKDPVLVGRTF